MSHFLRITFLAFIPFFSSAAFANSDVHPMVQAMLDQNEAPEGVVFDIETMDPEAWRELAGFVKHQITLLKQRYAELDIAVVSHGAEEFALQTTAQSQYADLHSMLGNLAKSEVSVHVCGAVGGLKGLTQEDFPDFVSYSESGLAQINDYKALDYSIVPIRTLTHQQREQLFEHPEKVLK